MGKITEYSRPSTNDPSTRKYVNKKQAPTPPEEICYPEEVRAHKEILPDFHIYVPILNEERLISSTVNALLEVFDAAQITVVDIGSTDNSVNRVPWGVPVVRHRLPAKNSGRFFTDLKNEYSRRQKWVFWVDGDEIYPTQSLLRLKQWTIEALAGGHEQRQCQRIYWRFMLESPSGSGYETSREFLYGGSKLFNSEIFWFRRAWPKEVVARRDDIELTGVRDGKMERFNGVWCWHGTMLNRSSVYTKGDRKKSEGKKVDFLTGRHGIARGKTQYEVLDWDHAVQPPWVDGYDVEDEQEWVFWHTSMTEKKVGTWPPPLD